MGATGAALRGGDTFDIALGAFGSAFGGKLLGALNKSIAGAGAVGGAIGGGLYGYGLGEQYVFNSPQGMNRSTIASAAHAFNPNRGSPATDIRTTGLHIGR
jgi:hypothetical protein